MTGHRSLLFVWLICSISASTGCARESPRDAWPPDDFKMLLVYGEGTSDLAHALWAIKEMKTIDARNLAIIRNKMFRLCDPQSTYDWGGTRDVGWALLEIISTRGDVHDLGLLALALGHKDERFRHYAAKAVNRLVGASIDSFLVHDGDSDQTTGKAFRQAYSLYAGLQAAALSSDDPSYRILMYDESSLLFKLACDALLGADKLNARSMGIVRNRFIRQCGLQSDKSLVNDQDRGWMLGQIIAKHGDMHDFGVLAVALHHLDERYRRQAAIGINKLLGTSINLEDLSPGDFRRTRGYLFEYAHATYVNDLVFPSRTRRTE